jgi:hypothetical protein
MMSRTFSLIVLLGAAAGFGPAAAQQAAPAQQPAASATETRDIPDTLMFDIDEYNEIQSRMASAGDAAAQRGDQSSIENASLYLSTIIYYGPKEWTIWVNGVPISPDQDFQSFTVADIGPDFVELLVPLSAQGMAPVKLSPNQTFIVRSGAVVEGQWRQ